MPPTITEVQANDHAGSRRELAATIGRSTLFGIGSNVAQIGTRLITVPIVIAHLGLDGYGIWSVIMTAAAYMRFGSVGIKSAFQKYVAEATGSGDFRKVNQLLSTGTYGMLLLSVAGLIPIALFSKAIARAAGVPAQFLGAAAGSISLLALIMLLSNAGAVYEGIVMGGHRIDLTRKFGMFFTVSEAIAIITLLQMGYGLFAMSAVMAVSEVGYVSCCYVASKRLLPIVQIRIANVTRSVIKELITYAGSYQLVNVLEIIYTAILPIALLRYFGATATGLYAIAARLSSAALMPQESLLGPVLSGGSKVFGSGSAENMKLLLSKSFKTVLILSIPPLAFISAFGSLIVFSWTGEASPLITVAITLISAAGLFRAIGVLELVLYRISGKALLDNIRQVLRIVLVLAVGYFGNRLGFYGILACLAAVELLGMVFMFFAISGTFKGFTVRMLLPDMMRLIAATILIVAIGWLASYVPFPQMQDSRTLAILRLMLISFVSLAATWPALYATGSISGREVRAVLDSFKRKIHAAPQPAA